MPTPRALEALVEENADFVYRCLRRLGLDEASAQDGAQQVFLVAAKKRSSIFAGKEKAFLYSTAKFVAADLRRRASRRAEIEFLEQIDEETPLASSDGPSLDELLDRRRARDLLDEVLAAMSEKLRDVFVLSEIEEMSAPEVAGCLDIAPGTVASRLMRAREEFDTVLNRIQKSRAPRKMP